MAPNPTPHEKRFRFWLESQGLAAGTVKNYVYGARTWLDWCQENDVKALDPARDDLRTFMGDLLASHSRSNVELMKISLRRFFTYLIDGAHHPGPNPVVNFPIRKREAEPAEPFTRDELAKMLAVCRNHQERAVYLLLVGGGLRRGEIYGIKRDDVNVETGTIRVDGKTGPRLNKPGRAVIDAVMAAMEFSERLCPQADIEVVWRIVQALAKRAGIRGRCHPHRFRHSFAVSFLEAGGKAEDLMNVLGHARLEQSLFYARAGAKRRALEAQESLNLAETLLNLTPRIQPLRPADAVSAAVSILRGANEEEARS